MWFIQGNKFNKWGKDSSLLWIRGNRTFLPPCQPLYGCSRRSWFFSGLWKEHFLVCSFLTILVIVR